MSPKTQMICQMKRQIGRKVDKNYFVFSLLNSPACRKSLQCIANVAAMLIPWNFVAIHCLRWGFKWRPSWELTYATDIAKTQSLCSADT